MFSKKTEFKLSKKECETLVSDLAGGRIESEQLKNRSDCAIYRIFLARDTAIIKLWNRPGIRGIIRRTTKTSPAYREIGALSLLQKTNVTVPQILGFIQVSIDGFPWTDAVFFEDIGVCTKAINHVKMLVSEKNEIALSTFLNEIIEMTHDLVSRGIVDLDHTFNNIVATSENKATRLDFERAYHSYVPWFPARYYGRMLGFLISTYVFAVQPDIGRASDFAQKLISKLKPPSGVLRSAQLYIDGTLELQKRRNGVDTKFTLPDLGRAV